MPHEEEGAGALREHDEPDPNGRQAQILDAARALAARPATKLTVAEVARLVGVSSQAVYRYFPDRDALFRAALGEEFALQGGLAGRRRQEVLDAALRLFARDGYRETTVAGLATEVGLSEAALYRYFDGKEQIFSAIVKERLAAVSLTRRTSSAEPREAAALLRSVAEQVVSSFEQQPEAMRVIFSEGLRHRPTARIVYEELLLPSATSLAKALEELARRGSIRAVEADTVASAYLGMFAFYMMVTEFYMPAAGLAKPPRRQALLDELVEVFDRGLRNPPSSSAPAGSPNEGGKACG
jgi:AcrR family transcriptional regulator